MSVEIVSLLSTDFAVGAPYDGVDERGAVYIFHGSKTGVKETYSQVSTTVRVLTLLRVLQLP